MFEDKFHLMNMDLFDFDKHLKLNIIKILLNIIQPLIIADIDELVVVKLDEIHDDDGKQIHCPIFVVISCKHEHDVIVQFLVKQSTKFRILISDFFFACIFSYLNYN